MVLFYLILQTMAPPIADDLYQVAGCFMQATMKTPTSQMVRTIKYFVELA